MATSTIALCVFLLINLATLGHQLELGPSSIERTIHHSQSQSSIKGPKLPRKILHGVESIDGAMVKEAEGVRRSESSEAGMKSSPSAGEILEGLRDHGSISSKQKMRNQGAVAELKSDVVDNSKGITSSEIQKKVRLLIEDDEHADRSRELDRDALYKSRIPNSDHSDCSHVGIGVCPPVPQR